MTNAVPIDAMKAPATPDEPAVAGRIGSLDLIRGVAVLGILAANMVGFALPGSAHRVPTMIEDTFAEKLFWLINLLFVDGKMRGLFTVLFGAGVALFLEHARAKGGKGWWLQYRRLFWLWVFGSLHFLLFFEGDILLDYAVVGAFLVPILLIRRMPNWALVALAAVLLVWDGYGASSHFDPDFQTERAVAAGTADAQTARDYAEWRSGFEADTRDALAFDRGASFIDMAVDRNEQDTPISRTIFVIVAYGAGYLALMLIGAALYRAGFFTGNWNARKVAIWSGIGIVFSVVVALGVGLAIWQSGFGPATTYFYTYAWAPQYRLPMIVGLAGLLVVATPKLGPTWLGERISAAGRMAFTNYIAMSVIFPVFFHGWGFGLIAQVPRWGIWLFVLAGWALMLGWSKPWLDRYRFGPLEWLWRCLTYWKVFAFRR